MVTTLAQVVARTGRLTQGQAVTVGVAIARELAVLHAGGHVYAGVSAETIRISPEGRPMLAAAAAGGGEPVDDLRDLVSVLRASVGAGAGLALLRVLGTPTEAAAFADDLYAVCAPEPLDVAPPESVRRSQRVPRLRVLTALAATVVVAGVVGVASAHVRVRHAAAALPVPDVPPPQTPAATAASSHSPATKPDWRHEMTTLDRRRNTAFVRGNEAALADIYVPGSPALAADRVTLHALVAHHVHARGLHLTVVSVRALRATARAVTLRVVDRLSAYDIVDLHGDVVAHHPRRGNHMWRITLVRIGPDWRISAVD
ncbi:MAG: hypothetical protein ACJ735_00530 [Actinomycetes bacterium]